MAMNVVAVRLNPALRVLRWAVPAAYCFTLALFLWRDGVWFARDRLLMWIVLGLLAFSVTDLRRWARGVLVEWLPFALILWAYDLLRGMADDLWFSTHYLPQLRADELLAGGTVPTVWLQEQLWNGAGHLQWYDYASWLVYVSYFLSTYLVAAALWFFAPDRFRRYVATVALIAMMGFLTYALFPAAPPWLASEVGHLDPTTRITGYVWSEITIANFNSLFERGSQYANPVAAVPSLHAAYTLLIVLFLWRSAGRLRPLLALYPVAMAFSLMYMSEHYFSDILLGWIYAVFAFWTVNAVADRLAQRRAHPEPAT
jgi:membrane-associated phospholipid phosphatase